jgi:ATP-dependent helicase HrpB
VSSGLPIDEALPALRAALAAHASVVLVAPPGAGKSTVVPLELLREPWTAGKRIVMLEPRRLAARAVARRMAATLGEDVGHTVGYRMRLDTRVSRATRVEVVTEGVLTRMLQNDPALEGVALLVFDEFHERSLQADLGLALALDAREALAPDLKVLVMSATLEAEPLVRLLTDCALVTAAGRAYPVETRYVGKGAPVLPGAGATAAESPERIVAATVQRALAECGGDVLVFLPGARGIRRVQALLEEGGAAARVLPLFGELDPAEQDAALAPSLPGQRKVVLATNIAETSLTIEGVRVVVDSGLARFALFDPATGMGRLETRRISRASAEQRQGRAGRTAPGVCYRCWSEGAHRSLSPATPPEVLNADLAPLALELAGWGASAVALRWLDPPPAPMLASAHDLLQRLGALDVGGRVTRHGREMAQIAVHPRLAHMLLRGRALGATRLAAELAALLSERDLLRGAAGRDADIRTRLEALRGERGAGADRAARQRSRRFAAELVRQLGGDTLAGGAHERLAGVLLAFAYPDRIGRRRPGSEARYALANGRGATFAEAQPLARSELIVAVELDDRDRDARILLAAPLAADDLLAHFAADIERRESVEWSSRDQAVVARRTARLGALVLSESQLPQVPADAAAAAMLAGVRELGLDALPWTDEARDLQARMEFARRVAPQATADWPAADDASLAAGLERWLAPWLGGVTRRADLARLDLAAILLAQLTYAQQRKLDELAPRRLEVPSGSQIRIDYRDENAPVVAVRLQEVFGLTESPRLGGGTVPVTFKLLSPAHRPVQITRDLASFWRVGYVEVRKDLRGRYPKHYWPDDPLRAEPTRGVRRRPPPPSS